MTGRNAHVFRLDIIYPEGSREPGWQPDSWESFLRSLPPLQRRRVRKAGFRWPRERMFLSSSSAYDRACLLRAFGADVQVLRSDPVTWPAHWTWEDEAATGHALQYGAYDASGLLLAPEETTPPGQVYREMSDFYAAYFEEVSR